MKIISNKLYNEYTKTTIDYHTDYSKITKEQLYDTFKFHCQGQRILNEVVEYIYKLIQQDKETIEDIENENDRIFNKPKKGETVEYSEDTDKEDIEEEQKDEPDFLEERKEKRRKGKHF